MYLMPQCFGRLTVLFLYKRFFSQYLPSHLLRECMVIFCWISFQLFKSSWNWEKTFRVNQKLSDRKIQKTPKTPIRQFCRLVKRFFLWIWREIFFSKEKQVVCQSLKRPEVMLSLSMCNIGNIIRSKLDFTVVNRLELSENLEARFYLIYHLIKFSV